ncbi:hypothetical protein PILCRDRAFT_827205 [Piloderma croceum F 1598]|uniref:ubiquitinyl hydrolase 1 n=1 Tax=Piloderma croceum (strain F 1598) TaxID=765440 RepID=A0A0C3F6D0_PILCF|nr:hypothetical protein PILCRDRAFT_827205 [Piloderma croceum F 1598]
MAGLESLSSLIYHEKQQQGSMLCAQHALNSLLQGNFFTAPDLSLIANSLDLLEESYDDANTGRNSTNMDDTGFFSVQVLENALNVWGLSLIRWRSEQMRPYQDHPHTQLAFILNFQQHWFTLRRFGHAEPNIDSDTGNGHWFNLNSSLNAPEWVSKLYLGMVLQQAESEGYSVFAIIQTDPQAPLALNRTEADEVASTLPEPAHSSFSPTVPHLSTAQKPSDSASGSSQRPTEGVEGFEDEDMELQAALQASLMGGAVVDFSLPLPRGSSSAQQTGARTPTQQQQQRYFLPMAAHPPAELPLPPLGFPRPQQQADDPDDPVAASMARNRAIMDRMRREQEMALREQYEEEVARVHGAGADVSVGADTGNGIGSRTRGARRTRADEEEEEMMRRAIEESRANSGSSSSSPVVVDDDEEAAEVDDGMMIVSDDEDEEYRPQVTRIPPPVPAPASGAHVPALSYPSHRVYDDDDAELQAALKASLESVPDGFTIPDPPPLPVAPPPTSVSTPGTSSASTRSSEHWTEDDEVASQASTETSQVQEPQVSVDEMRRRRLARFGG